MIIGRDALETEPALAPQLETHDNAASREGSRARLAQSSLLPFRRFFLVALLSFGACSDDGDAAGPVDAGPPDGSTHCLAAGSYDEVLSLSGPDGTYEQHFRLYVPAELAPGAPVIMQLHGAGGSIEGMVAVTGLEEVADVEGFVVVTPFGFPIGPGTTAGVWNSGGPFAAITSRDHVVALGRILDEVTTLTRCGEGAPVFAAGQSNGAMMTYRLACEDSERYSGIVISAGYLADEFVPPLGEPETLFACEPERALPLLHIHGLQDPLIPFEGNPLTGQPAIEDNIAEWRARYGCSEPGSDTEDGPVRRRSWSCEGGVPIEFITVADHGHPWAGSPPETVNPAVFQGPQTEALSATEELVRFVRARVSGD